MTENMKNKDVTSLVSVVVPIYNVESYLKECVDSILFQTYKNIEVILVDDESPDSCGKMCDDYEKMDTRIKVVHKKNGGLSDARNAGMKVATGDLITFVDSDDYISKDFIEILFEAMLENKSDIAIANMKRTSKRDEKNTSTAWKTSNFKSEDALISMLYGIPFGTSACGKLFKRNLFKGVEFPYGKFSEDLFTIYKTILKSKSVTYVEFDGYFYYYRDEGSIVVSGYKEKHLEALDAVDDIAGAVKGKTQFDNALCVDEKGNVITGDHILYIYGCYMKEYGELMNNTVVTTVMSNFGLYKAFDEQGIGYAKTAVGDKYVYEYMAKNGCRVGGEQSGHIIFSKYASTGDGILTSLKMMEVMLAKKLPMSKLAEPLKIYPQVLENVRVTDKKAAQNDPAVQEAVKVVAEALGDAGRILVRESGTEPLVRVMVEAPDHDTCQKYVSQVVEVIKNKGYAV